MRLDAGSFARGSGGVSGNWSRFVSVAPQTAAGNNLFMVTPNTLADSYLYNSNDFEQTRKITYYTARYSGFQVGVSYTPDTANLGSINEGTIGAYPRNVKDLWSAGVSYSNQFDQVAFNASAIGEMGTGVNYTTETKKHKLKGYEFGANLTTAGFTVGGSYGQSEKGFSHVGKNTALLNNSSFDSEYGLVATDPANNKNVKYWTAGVAYVQGPAGVSVSYLDSNYQNNKVEAVSLSLDYALAPGMMPYVEATSFTVKPAVNYNGQTYAKNKGQSYIVGTQFNF